MPVFAIVFSYILIREIISIQTLLFAVLIISGVALAQKNTIKKFEWINGISVLDEDSFYGWIMV